MNKNIQTRAGVVKLILLFVKNNWWIIAILAIVGGLMISEVSYKTKGVDFRKGGIDVFNGK